MLKINEIFYSRQGEGPLRGKQSVFIRTAGCNLACSYCDTKYANNGKDMEFVDIQRSVARYRCLNVVITGGEPTIHQDLNLLTHALHGYHITLETNGLLYVRDLHVDIVSISPKLQNSGNINGIDYHSLRMWLFRHNCYFKFVVANSDDVDEVNKVASDGNISKDIIYLMPMGSTKAELQMTSPIVKKLAIMYGYRYTPRQHVMEGWK